MKFTTRSGSLYEVRGHEIRRLAHKSRDYARMPLGEWKLAQDLDIAVGHGALILWPDGSATSTSRVESIEL